MAKKKTRKFKISFAVVLFALIFIYLIYHVLAYAFSTKIISYEIGEVTSLATNKTYTGLALRSETVTKAEAPGYVNYFVKSSGRVAVGDIVYSIDENGEFNDVLSSNDGSSGLSTTNLETITTDLSNFSKSYSGAEFSDVYTLKSDMKTNLIGFLDVSSDEAIEKLGVDARYFHTYKSETIGIVEYYTDGFEGFDVTKIEADTFDQENYTKVELTGGSSLAKGDSAYKTITSEKWQVVISLTDEEAEKYKEETRLDIYFNEIGATNTCLFEEIQGADGSTYGVLTLSKYMISYANDRFLTITIEDGAPSGYKIPVSAVTECEYYIIPVEYITQGGNTNDDGFIQITTTSEGEVATNIAPDIVYQNEKYAFVPKDQLELGSVLAMPDSNERCAVSATAKLPGVLSITKGYATFKIIEVLDENSEYKIVQTGTSYGVSAYDNIVLDATTVEIGQKIY